MDAVERRMMHTAKAIGVLLWNILVAVVVGAAVIWIVLQSGDRTPDALQDGSALKVVEGRP
jgi:hypothetical protein